jgi:hypothetical protein
VDWESARLHAHPRRDLLCGGAGFWAEKLWLRNGRREARQTEESERGRADVREVLDELEDIDARKREEFDYQQRFDAGLRAFTSEVAARYDAEVKRLQAQQALAVAKFLSAPPAGP